MLWTIAVILLVLWALGLVTRTRWEDSFTFSWSSRSWWCWSMSFRDGEHCSHLDLCRWRNQEEGQ